MKCAFLLESAGISGGSYVVFEYAIRMKRRGNDISIVTVEPVESNDYKWHPEAEELNWITYEETQNISFDVVVATYWKTAHSLYKIKAKRYCFFVQSIESRFYLESDQAYRWFVDSAYLLPVNYITQATWIKNYLMENYGHDAQIVHNGIRKDIYTIDGNSYANRIEGKLRVLIEGPFGFFFKNIERTIELCRKASADEIWLLTSSNLKSYDGIDRVFSRLPIRETPKVYRSCDVLVKLSYVEGMFGPPLEIFHCGGTAIVYNVTGSDEYIKHNTNALVVEENDETKVVSYINELKNNPDLLERLKLNALKTANKWPDWEMQSFKFEKALEKIITSNLLIDVSQKLLKKTIGYSQTTYKNIAGVKFNYYLAELYPDTGSGYNEKQVLTKTIVGDEKWLEFDLRQYRNIRSLRFDPLNDFCVVQMNRIVIVRADNTSYEFENYYNNAVHHENRDYIFTTKDPQFYLDIFDEKIQKVIIELRYIAIGKETLGYFGEAHATKVKEYEKKTTRQIRQIHEQQMEIHKKDEELRYTKKTVHTLQKQLDDMIFTHKALLQSRAWKVVESVQKLKSDLKSVLYCCLYYHQYRVINASGLFDKAFYLKKQPDLHHVRLNFLFHYIRFGAKEGRDPHPLFDAAYYISQYPDLEASGINPLAHYIEVGAKEGKDPHPLFDAAYYLAQSPELDSSVVSPLAHYMEVGAKEGKNPHPLFDAAYYISRYPALKASETNPLIHYMEVGAKEGKDPHPLFDAAYYINQYPELETSNINPLLHYIETGAKAGKDPHPLFDSAYYLKQSSELTASGINPLAHYIEVGAKEQRDPHPLFDSTFYLGLNPKGEPGTYSAAHYILIGAAEQKDPHPFFDSKYYINRYSDIAASGMNPLIHYIQSGADEKRNPHPLFDSHYYLEQNPHIEESGMNPLVHYVQTGISESKNPNPQIDLFSRRPTISIVTPVYDVEDVYLHSAIKSVLNQIYQNWELCIVDDGSSRSHIKPILQSYAEKDKRIKVKSLTQNKGIAAASNEGVSLASGEYIGFLDHDDVLTVDALFEMVKTINKYDPDVLYSDERIIDEEGRYLDTVFKPDFSPDLLFSHNYITHFLLTRRSLFNEIGGFSSKYEGAQDYDLILRLAERTKKITHIPKTLYHWRSVSTSTSANPQVKLYADDAGKMALQNAMDRKKIGGIVLKANQRFFYRVKREISDHPLISIVIPFKDQSVFLKKCISSILEKSNYQNFEILGINNNSEESDTLDITNDLLKADKRVQFFDYNDLFNYSKINNFGVGLAEGEHIVLLNNDIEIINVDWIECLLEHSQREEVGAVGAKLYYPDGSIQHAGVIIGIAGFAGHSHRHYPHDDPGHYNRLMCIQNISAVSGALLMVKKRLYEEMGGLDEVNLSVALNDVDFCLRLREKGYLNIFTPYCEAIHDESASRGYEEDPEKKIRFSKEIKYFQKKWKRLLDKGDPYYNPNLTLGREDFSQKSPEEGAYNH